MTSSPDSQVDPWVIRYPPAGMSPAEFERFVASDLFGAAREAVDDLRVTLHERITGLDGCFDFDATVRYRWAGVEFLCGCR